jgi:hypothetical protein
MRAWIVVLAAACCVCFGAYAQTKIPDPANDSKEGSKDLLAVQFDQQGDSLTIRVTSREASDFHTLLIFFDTDRKPATGFDPPAKPGGGYELLIQGPVLYKFSGKDRTAWQWEKVVDLERKVEGNTQTLALDAGLLQASAIDVTAFMMSDDYQQLLDVVPDKKPVTVTLRPVAPATQQSMQLSPPKANRNLPPRERFAQAKSFYTFYGSKRVAELSRYDVAILHHPQMDSRDVKTLSKLGVVTIGYITVGEDDELNLGDGTGPDGKASWYLDRDKDSKPDQNGIWKSWFVNANDPKWRESRVAQAKVLREYGFDGIFLDTIDTAENYAETAPGMIKLIEELREAIPNGVIILNQGLGILPSVARYADGLMLESFTATYDFDQKQYRMNLPQSLDYHTRRSLNIIAPVQKQHPLSVLVLDYAKKTDLDNIQLAADRAATFGYLFSCSPIFLDDVYPDVPTGKPDRKWLELQSSPDSMAFVMKEEKSGFPAGTCLRPSGCYAGYTIDPIVDGRLDRRGLPWSKAAWASSEDGDIAWVDFTFPAPIAASSLTIYFHDESGPSRAYSIEVQREGEPGWTSVERIDGNSQRNRTHELPAGIKALRILQMPGGGSVGRPNLLWIAQVTLEQRGKQGS